MCEKRCHACDAAVRLHHCISCTTALNLVAGPQYAFRKSAVTAVQVARGAICTAVTTATTSSGMNYLSFEATRRRIDSG